MRKIVIKGKKFDYDEESDSVVLSPETTRKVLSAVRRYPNGGEGRGWKVIARHVGGKGEWWVTDLKNRIRYTVQTHFFDRRNYIRKVEKYRVL